MDIDCICDEHHRKCQVYPGGELPCKEYVVKFMEIDRTEEEAKKKLEDLSAAVKDFKKTVDTKIKQINKHKIK